jgi:ABC-type antimicrobial peptide transport system permease subunit
LALNQTLQAAIVGTSSTDYATIAGTLLFLAATAVVAALLPTRRATRLDPVAALRHE